MRAGRKGKLTSTKQLSHDGASTSASASAHAQARRGREPEPEHKEEQKDRNQGGGEREKGTGRSSYDLRGGGGEIWSRWEKTSNRPTSNYQGNKLRGNDHR